ncbi:MAG: hypothetical protein TREMPRED_005136 [Tremellales sp. Tagirdzhanova-0007]|nr:MAG: hypothetical protein TREMPRED_005136 [Tremellales sp. Tagirdzhanova-0007]
MSLSHEVRDSTNITNPSTDRHIRVSFTIGATESPPTRCLKTKLHVLGVADDDEHRLDLYMEVADSLYTKLKRWEECQEGLPVGNKLRTWDKEDDTTKADIITKIKKGFALCISEAQQDGRFSDCGTHVCATQVNKDCAFLKRDDSAFKITVSGGFLLKESG